MKYVYHVFFALFAASASFAATIDLSTLTGDYEAQNGDVLTGTLNGEEQPYKITIADGASVTLSDATINGSNQRVCSDGSDNIPCVWAGITCLGNCTIRLSGSNTVKGFYQEYPGIQAAKRIGEGDEYTLTIEGDGSLEATGGSEGAGIGSAWRVNCGNIIISGGTVTATGGNYAAGIGSGNKGLCGNVTISGGIVTATSGGFGAGIGSGYGGTFGDITISGGTVTATGGDGAAGIGGGREAACGAITISGGEVSATGGDDAAGIGSGYVGTSGDITIINDVTKVVAIRGRGAPYHSVGAGYMGEVGKVTIGDVEGAIEKELFVFPATPVDVVAVGDKKFAVIAGDYSGDDALSIVGDKSVDRVIFDRTFPAIEGDNNYSTIMFPFEINADKVGNVKQVFSFLGIDLDEQNRKYVAVEQVDKFEAYKPYLIQLESGETSISINNTSPLVIKASPTDPGAYDVAQDDDYNKVGDYVFRGVIQAKSWDADDPDVLGTSNAAAYGFAGTATADLTVGQFARVGEGASIRPFRAYIYKKPVSQAAPPAVESSVSYAYQPAPVDDLPDVMDVVVVDRKKSGEGLTTVIGKFNSRTGEIRLNRTTRTYDLNGRHVRNAGRMAKGVYLGK